MRKFFKKLKLFLLPVLILGFVGLGYADTLDPTYTKLLCDFDGTNGATSYTSDDANARTATFYNSAQLSTAQKVFGTASLLLASATSDYLTFESYEWINTSSDFTIGFRVRFNSIDSGTWQTVFSGNDGDSHWGLFIRADAIDFYSSDGVDNYDFYNFPAVGWVVDTWYAMELDYVSSSNTTYIFRNGTLIDTWGSFNFPNITTIGYVGIHNVFGYSVDGYIDELYILKGQALHTANYTVPTSPYTVSSAQPLRHSIGRGIARSIGRGLR